MRRGVLTRRFAFRTRTAGAPRSRSAGSCRWPTPSLAGMDSTFVAENWSGRLIVRAGHRRPGRPTAGCARYRGLGEHAPAGDRRPTAGRRRHRRPGRGDDLESSDPGQPRRPAPGARRRQGASGALSGPWCTDDGYIGQDVPLDLQRGRAGHRREGRRAVHLAGPGDQRAAPRRRAARVAARRRTCDELLARHVLAWDHLWERCDLEIDAAARPWPAGCTCTCSTCCRRCPPAQRRPRRGHPGPRPARRGLPRPHLLGRACSSSRS